MSATRWIIAVCSSLGSIAAGCAAESDQRAEGRSVTPADFARPRAPQPPQESTAGIAAAAVAGSEPPPSAVAEEGPYEDSMSILAVEERPVLWVSRPGERVIVDSLVGEVNGRPIFADAFFEPIEDRLMRAAEEFSGAERDAKFREIINFWLQQVVLDALILAEAESSLTPQEKQGLFAFLQSIQEEEIRLGGGTRSGAESRRAQSGENLDQYIGRQKEMVLIDQLRQQKIQPRVIVTWRDIEREYRRRYDDFNPPATVTLARIRLRTGSDSERIEEVTVRLAAGEPFADVAGSLGPENGGFWQTFVIEGTSIEDINVSPEIKAALHGLEEGRTSEPFELGTVTIWLHVAEVSRPEARSIYDPDVQRILKNTVLMRRSEEEWSRYIQSLVKRGIHSELDGMAETLYRIALERYSP